jgi:hypothetical protein
LLRVDAATGQHLPGAKPVAPIVLDDSRLIAFSRDRQTLAFSLPTDPFVTLIDLATGKKRTFQRLPGLVRGVVFTADGKTLLLIGGDGTNHGLLQRWDTTTLAKGPVDQLPGVSISLPTVSADAATLAYFEQRNGVTLWDLAGRKLKRHLAMAEKAVTALAFSRDGKRLAIALGDEVRIVDVLSGKELLSLCGSTHRVTELAFSPGGRRLASAGDREELSRGADVRLWDLVTGREILDLAGHGASVSHLQFSPDGRRLAAAFGGDKNLLLVRLGGGSTKVVIWNAEP